MRRWFFMLFAVVGMGAVLSGCLTKKGVSISGDENHIVINSSEGYDTLAVAQGHCGSYKRKAVFAGRNVGAGQDIISRFNCMVR